MLRATSELTYPGSSFGPRACRQAEREDKDDPSVKLTGKAGVATQALLREPQRWWHVTELAAVAEVSPALAHRVFSRLERDDLITVDGVGPKRVRRVANATAPLDLLAEELQDRRVKQVRAYRLARDARAHAHILSDQLTDAGFDHAVTGPAGAARPAPFVTSIPVVDIWITEAVDLDLAVETVGAESVLEGHNILLKQEPADAPLVFRNKVEGVWTSIRSGCITTCDEIRAAGRSRLTGFARK